MAEVTLNDIKSAYRVIDSMLFKIRKDNEDGLRDLDLSHREILSLRITRDFLANKITRSLISADEIDDMIRSDVFPHRR